MRLSENKSFKDMTVDFFEETTKTGWGKKEIVKIIKDLWILYLESNINLSEKGGD